MTTSRRSLIAAGAALALPGEALAAWPFRSPKGPQGCKGRVAYGGAPLHAGLEPALFDAAAKAGATRATPYAGDALDSRLEKIVQAMKTRSFTAAIARSDGTLWTLAQGAAPEAFEWPCLAEVFVATAILHLVEENKLTLETTVERWAPEVPTARWITVEDLLSHVSGLTAPLQATYCPGAGWAPTAGDYDLLGRIVAALDNKLLPAALTYRLVEGLELKETRIVAAPGGGLAVIASASDAVRFGRALLGERLHSQAMTRRRFARLYPMTAAPTRTWWGLGVMVSDLAADKYNPADTWLGLSRARLGVSATIAYSPRKRAFCAAALTGEGSPDAAIDLMLLDVQADPSVLNFTPLPPKPARKPRPPPRGKARKRPG